MQAYPGALLRRLPPARGAGRCGGGNARPRRTEALRSTCSSRLRAKCSAVSIPSCGLRRRSRSSTAPLMLGQDRRLDRGTGRQLGDRDDPRRALPVVAEGARLAGVLLAAPVARGAGVLARPSRGDRFLGLRASRWCCLPTGLPWAGVWGSALRIGPGGAGLGERACRIGRSAATIIPARRCTDHHRGGWPAMAHGRHSTFVARPAVQPGRRAGRRASTLAFPASVLPPGAPQAFRAADRAGVDRQVRSAEPPAPARRDLRCSTERTRNRPFGLRRQAPDRPDRELGIAWHEGQLLGAFNPVRRCADRG